MINLKKEQLTAVSKRRYASKMRRFLNEAFEESLLIPAVDMEATILEQTDKAATYGITAEDDLAAYLSCSWLMGTDFDQKFNTIQAVLLQQSLSGPEKAQALWNFTESSFTLLSGALPTREV